MKQPSLALPDKSPIELRLEKSEIELIRYTWNHMLSDSDLPISIPGLPGQYPRGDGGKPKMFRKGLDQTQFCRQFYSNLITLKPDLEEMFQSIAHQAASFAGVMSMVVAQLEHLDILQSYLKTLGKLHSRVLLIESFHFELMGEAFIHTFQDRFGSRFTPNIESLWKRLYVYLANSIIQFGQDPVAVFTDTDDDSIGDNSTLQSYGVADNSQDRSSLISDYGDDVTIKPEAKKAVLDHKVLRTPDDYESEKHAKTDEKHDKSLRHRLFHEDARHSKEPTDKARHSHENSKHKSSKHKSCHEDLGSRRLSYTDESTVSTRTFSIYEDMRSRKASYPMETRSKAEFRDPDWLPQRKQSYSGYFKAKRSSSKGFMDHLNKEHTKNTDDDTQTLSSVATDATKENNSLKRLNSRHKLFWLHRS